MQPQRCLVRIHILLVETDKVKVGLWESYEWLGQLGLVLLRILKFPLQSCRVTPKDGLSPNEDPKDIRVPSTGPKYPTLLPLFRSTRSCW